MAIDWKIHLVANGVRCAVCGDIENGFLPGMCDAHTHGMEKYGHPNFQIVLRMEDSTIMNLLNILGLRVQNGQRFQAGDVISDICEGYDIRLASVENDDDMLRVLIPDVNHLFPDDPDCLSPYNLQNLPVTQLYIEKSHWRN